MVNTPVVGYRFRPTDKEIVEKYLRPKNDLESDTSHVDQVITTVNIRNFDPWELPDQSIMKSGDQVWYLFGRKENKYNKGDRQIRKTKSGYWKKTGKPTEIKRKSGSHEKIGEKWVLVFHLTGGTRTKWVMHEYHATPSPNQMMMTYTLCKVKFKGEASEMFSPPSGEIEHNHSSITQMGNFGSLSTRSEGTPCECPQIQELENPLQFSGFLDVFEEIQFGDVMRTAIGNLSTDEWNNLLSDHSSDGDSNSLSIFATTGSIQTSSTWDSFGSSNHCLVQITNLQDSPNPSSIKSSQKVSQTPCQETKIGYGKEKIKKKEVVSFIG